MAKARRPKVELTIDEQVGVELRLRREGADRTIAEAAEAAGLAASELIRIEAGAVPASASVVFALTRFFGCTAGEIYDAVAFPGAAEVRLRAIA